MTIDLKLQSVCGFETNYFKNMRLLIFQHLLEGAGVKPLIPHI